VSTLRITCTCGKHIEVEPDFPYDKGKCPRCGRMLALRPEERAPASVVPQRSPRSRQTGLLLASATTMVSALIAVPALLLALSLRQDNARLAEQVEAIQASAPGGVEQTRRAGTQKPELARLRTQLDSLGQRVAELSARQPAEAAGKTTPRAGPITVNANTTFEAALMRVARRASPAVVAISTEKGAGSGVVISADGYILTNDHVVGGRRNIVAHFPSGERYTARILGKDSVSDVALLKVQARNLPHLSFGDSDRLQLGQVVIAMGNPFGLSRDGKPTITLGIISALHRIVMPGKGQRRYGDAIQTDAAINPGNSGGALVDIQGRLIGINGAISSHTGTSTGVGFAIPINFVKRVLPSLKQGRSTEPGYLGINVRDMAPSEARQTRLRGAVVTQVARRSPAARSGLRVGDLITHFQGRAVSSSTGLINRISYYQAGATVRIKVASPNRAPREISLKIASRGQLDSNRR